MSTSTEMLQLQAKLQCEVVVSQVFELQQAVILPPGTTNIFSAHTFKATLACDFGMFQATSVSDSGVAEVWYIYSSLNSAFPAIFYFYTLLPVGSHSEELHMFKIYY